MAATTIVSGLGGCIGASAVPTRGVIAFVEWAGRISVFDPAAATASSIGTGWIEPESIVVLGDGSTAFVSERGGDIWKVDLGAADRAAASSVAAGLTAPQQMALASTEDALFVVEYTSPGRLLRIDLATAAVDVLATGLDHPIGIAVASDQLTAFVTEQSTSGGRLTKVDLNSGSTNTVAAGFAAPFFLSWATGLPDGSGGVIADDAVLLIADRDPANRVEVIDLTAATPTRRSVSPVGYRPSSTAAMSGDLYVFEDTTISVIDVTTGLFPVVRLDMPTDPLFVGGWARVPVELGTSGIAFDDLNFEVDGGPLFGGVSLSRDPTFDPSHPDLMLLAGSQVGASSLRAIDRNTGSVVAEEKFEVTTEWPDEANGAPVQFIGESHAFVTGAAWGGGPAGPQNVDVFPATGTRRIAIVLVDTTDARYPTNATTLAGIRTEWQTELLGVVDPDTVTRGARQYFQEVSYGRFDISLVGGQVFGPFQLAGGWSSYFDWNTARSVWWAKGSFFQACVTAAQGSVDFDQVDTIVCVMRTVPAAGMTAAKFAWPVAGGGTFTYQRPGATTNSSRSFPALTMPDDWEVRDTGGRRNHETLSHEIGHNLGMGDLYMNLAGFDAAMQARDVTAWDLMSNENPLPHLSLAHRMMLGWVRPEWVRSFDFTATGGVDQPLTLQAAELIGMGGPPAGRVAGIEVRRANGWNYYFEYRAGQPGNIGDRALLSDRRVLGTDVTSPSFTVPQSRRGIIMLPNDPDGDGPVLGASADYEEPDPSGPANFQFDVTAAGADNAQVRVRYGAGGRPDPSIRPWPGGEVWQSPDIEIRNARSATRPEWFNTPWAGQLNTIVAKVTNSGNFMANGVRVGFWVKDFTIGNAPETLIGTDVRNVPVGPPVEFSTTWTPPASTPTSDAHYCIVVRIALYQDPGNPAIVELTEMNNWAQSNYTRFISSTASPASREITSVSVSNPYTLPTRVVVIPQQSTSWYRTYLDHSWLWLDPGETRSVTVMVESLLGDPAFPELEEMKGQIFELQHDLTLIGMIENSQDPQLHATEIMGGANVRVATGRRTRIEVEQLDEKVAMGTVVTVDDGRPVDNGDVVVSILPDGKSERAEYRSDQLNQGRFVLELAAGQIVSEAGYADLQVHYPGGFGLADSRSDVVSIKA